MVWLCYGPVDFVFLKHAGRTNVIFLLFIDVPGNCQKLSKKNSCDFLNLNIFNLEE